jgi:hypothetical protein
MSQRDLGLLNIRNDIAVLGAEGFEIRGEQGFLI